MSRKKRQGRAIGFLFLAISLGWILSSQAETLQRLAPIPARTVQPIIVSVIAGKSADVLIPGSRPKTQGRLVTVPSAGIGQGTPVPEVTVVPGDEDPAKTGRNYSIRTTARTPQGTYQLQYYDSQRKVWIAVPTNVVQVSVTATGQQGIIRPQVLQSGPPAALSGPASIGTTQGSSFTIQPPSNVDLQITGVAHPPG